MNKNIVQAWGDTSVKYQGSLDCYYQLQHQIDKKKYKYKSSWDVTGLWAKVDMDS